MILFFIGFNLLIDSCLGLLVSAANFVHQNVRNILICLPVDICLPLQYVHIADPIVYSRLKHCEHLFYELAVQEIFHIKNVLQGREIFDRTPCFRPVVGDNRPFGLCPLLTIFVLVGLLNGVHFYVAKHALKLAKVEDLELGVTKLILVVLAVLIQTEDELLHDGAVWTLLGRHLHENRLCLFLVLSSLFGGSSQRLIVLQHFATLVHGRGMD